MTELRTSHADHHIVTAEVTFTDRWGQDIDMYSSMEFIDLNLDKVCSKWSAPVCRVCARVCDKESICACGSFVDVNMCPDCVCVWVCDEHCDHYVSIPLYFKWEYYLKLPPYTYRFIIYPSTCS